MAIVRNLRVYVLKTRTSDEEFGLFSDFDNNEETMLIVKQLQSKPCIPVFVHQHLKETVAKWLTFGLDELHMDEDGHVQPRHTMPYSPEFLPRLAENIARQTLYFKSILIWEDE